MKPFIVVCPWPILQSQVCICASLLTFKLKAETFHSWQGDIQSQTKHYRENKSLFSSLIIVTPYYTGKGCFFVRLIRQCRWSIQTSGKGSRSESCFLYDTETVYPGWLCAEMACRITWITFTGGKWAPESHHGRHAHHQAAGGDHRWVWAAEDPGH